MRTSGTSQLSELIQFDCSTTPGHREIRLAADERANGGTTLLVIGGRQRELRPLSAGEDWYEYQNGVIVEVDVASGAAARSIEYESPREARPDEDATILFKSGTVLDDTLYVCTQTEVISYGLPEFEQTGYISLPMFNDLHHVAPTGWGTLVVADTGLDMVVELSKSGEVLHLWNTLGEDPWARFSPDVDYRKVRTTKPHRSHPNYVFVLGDEIWTTRFEQRDAICVNRPGKRIDIEIERVHDGVMSNGKLYFTTVDGHIVVADPERCEVSEVIDLTEMSPENVQLGWCRSLHVRDDMAWVGFSRIRPTKFRENVGWALRGFKRDFGTHVARYDLKKRERLETLLVEPFGVNAVFGVIPLQTGRDGKRN